MHRKKEDVLKDLPPFITPNFISSPPQSRIDRVKMTSSLLNSSDLTGCRNQEINGQVDSKNYDSINYQQLERLKLRRSTSMKPNQIKR
jgi:hypothetical protein